jgi:hypothetical protein
VTYNHAGRDGGGAYIGDGDPADVTGSVFAHDTALRDGGGYWLTDGGAGNIESSQFTANAAGRHGGGFWIGGFADLTGASVIGNLAAKAEGGIYLDPLADQDDLSANLAGTMVTGSRSGNCWPAGRVAGCTGFGAGRDQLLEPAVLRDHQPPVDPRDGPRTPPLARSPRRAG